MKTLQTRKIGSTQRPKARNLALDTKTVHGGSYYAKNMKNSIWHIL